MNTTHIPLKQFTINLVEISQTTSPNDTNIDSGDSLTILPDVNQNLVDDSEDEIQLPVQEIVKSTDIFALNQEIQKAEAMFALKLSSKNALSQEVVNDIFLFCSNIHEMKLELIQTRLDEKFVEKDDLKIQDVTDTVKLLDNITGLGVGLSTHYRRDKILKRMFDFIKPERIDIGKIRKELRFYYILPIEKTLTRLLQDESLRRHIISDPIFNNPNVQL